MFSKLSEFKAIEAQIKRAREDWLRAPSLDAIRESFEQLCQADQPRPPSVVAAIAGVPTETFGVDYRGCAALYLHGGGYQIGSTQSHRNLIDALSRAAERPVIGVNYRLAPEFRYPAALLDALAVYRELTSAGKAMSLMGDSAGAGLVLALFQMIRSEGLPLPPRIVLISAWLDLSLSGASYTERAGEDIFSTTEALALMARSYVGRHGTVDDPLVSPVRMALDGLPPTLIHAGGADITLSDSEDFATRARDAGRKVELKVWDGMFHHFQMFTDLPQSRESIAEIGSFLNTAAHPT